MPIQEQERALLEDLLYVFMGFEGQYVRYSDGYDASTEKTRLAGATFSILPGLESSLKDLALSMLRMATHFTAMEAFVDVQGRAEFGSVNHALCAIVRGLLKDYLVLVTQLEVRVLEDPSFTLHQMHLRTISAARSLNILHLIAQQLLKRNSLLEEASDAFFDGFDDADNLLERLREGGDLLPGSLAKSKCIGGNVLATLTQTLEAHSGDPAAKQLLETLLRETSRPYVAMLNEWLHHGRIKDPHCEFLIGERRGIRRERMDEDYTDEYWEKRYYIRDKEVPAQLMAVKDKILLAGKYLNVVHECGGMSISKDLTKLPQTFFDPGFLDNISTAYHVANNSLLSLLLADHSLQNRLHSLKHYFFLDRAEFFLYFLELASSELRKPHQSINVPKLQSLLDLVLRQPGSIAAADPYKEDVKVQMNGISLTQWLMKIVMVQGLDQDNPDASMIKANTANNSTDPKDEEKGINGFEALELDYAIPFPISLVISRKTVLRYQLLFRYTLSLRHLETMLVGCWFEHSKTRPWTHTSQCSQIELWKRRAWNLRARMLVFVQQMLFFATAEVIEPNWQKLMAKVDEAQASNPEDDRSALDPVYLSTKRSKRTVDELMQDHLDMLDSCMKDLGLTQSKLLKIHAKLTIGCTMFASYTASLSRSLYATDSGLTANPKVQQSKRLDELQQKPTAANSDEVVGSLADPGRMMKMEDTLKKYEDHFNRHLRILIDSLNYYAATETVVLLSLCARLTAAEIGVYRNHDGPF